jgi:hypothetical protein
MLPRVSILLFIFAFVVPLCGAAFLGTATQSKTSITTTTTPIQSRLGMTSDHPFCDLPGDPSLILTTNVDLGDKKIQIMKSISKAIEQHTGKPESYIGT